MKRIWRAARSLDASGQDTRHNVVLQHGTLVADAASFLKFASSTLPADPQLSAMAYEHQEGNRRRAARQPRLRQRRSRPSPRRNCRTAALLKWCSLICSDSPQMVPDYLLCMSNAKDWFVCVAGRACNSLAALLILRRLRVHNSNQDFFNCSTVL
jgi:hypothetical protein